MAPGVIRRSVLCFALVTISSWVLTAQEARRTLTNADVLNMAKAGIGEQTIVLSIGQGPTNFDTSPEALIELKKSGVSDGVLSAMLQASPSGVHAAGTSGAASRKGCELLDKPLEVLGPREDLTSIHAVRLSGSSIRSTAAGTVSSPVESVTVYPDRIRLESQAPSTGLLTQIVVTPEFNYIHRGESTWLVPSDLLQDLRTEVQVDPVYVSQHLSDYTCVAAGTEEVGNVTATKIKISSVHQEFYWDVDPATHQLLRIAFETATSGEATVDLSGWQQVAGVYEPFKRHSVANGQSTDITISKYEVNPAIEPRLFENTYHVMALGQSPCKKNVSFAVAEGGQVVPRVPGFAAKWIEDNRTNYRGLCFYQTPEPKAANYLLVFSTSRAAFNGFEPSIRTTTSTSTTPVFGSGTITNNYGSMWNYTYNGTETTTTTTTSQENAPYTINSLTMFLAAYNDHGSLVSQHWRTVSSKQGGDPYSSLGYNLGSLLGSIHIKARLLKSVIEDVTRAD